MRSRQFLRVVWAFVARGFQEASRARSNNVVAVASMLVALLSCYFLARYIGPEAERVGRFGGYFGFSVVGLAGIDLFAAVASAPARRIREAQLAGTLDAMLATPTPESWVVLLLGAWDLCAALLRVVFYLLVSALAFGVSFRIAPATVLVGLLAALVAFVPIGLCGAALTMLLRRADPLSLFLTMASSVFGAVFYPMESLPEWARFVALTTPLTPALAVLRSSLFEAATIRELSPTLGFLLLQAGGFWLAGSLIFWAALKRVRVDGSLTSY